MAYYWLGLSVSGSGADCDWLREHIAYYWLGLSVSAEVWLIVIGYMSIWLTIGWS